MASPTFRLVEAPSRLDHRAAIVLVTNPEYTYPNETPVRHSNGVALASITTATAMTTFPRWWARISRAQSQTSPTGRAYDAMIA
jgi:hypothetical protein